MSDHRPRRPDRKLGFIAPLTLAIAVVVVGAVALLLSRDPPPEPPPPPAPVGQPAPAPPAPAAPLPLTRAELIEAAAAAGERTAFGSPPPRGRDPLIGRQFAVRIAFGCGGAAPAAIATPPASGQAFAVLDRGKGTLRLVARPEDWSDLPLIQGLSASEAIEAVEGFWLPHPWTLAEGCLPASGEAAQLPQDQTLGLAQIFTEGESRAGRHQDRPYEFVRKIPPNDQAVLAGHYWLVLEGRLVGFGDSAIRCWSASPGGRPTCLFSVALDRVAFVEASSGDQLAEWRE